MARSRAQRSAKRRQEDRAAFAITGVAGVALAGIVAVMMSLDTPELGPDGCLANQVAPKAHTLVLVDQTDSFDENQLDYAKIAILAEYNRLKLGEKLSVVSLDANPTANRAGFEKCRLPQGVEVSELIANPIEIEQTFQQTVGKEMTAFIESLRGRPQASASPILEVVASTVDRADFSKGVDRRRLVIISDMAQASADVTHYGAATEAGSFAIAPDVSQSLARDLSGVDVRIHYLRRASLRRMQTPAHACFWTTHFKEQGANATVGWGLEMMGLAQQEQSRGGWDKLFPKSEEEKAAEASAAAAGDPCLSG
jgi:hypothetical protein